MDDAAGPYIQGQQRSLSSIQLPVHTQLPGFVLSELAAPLPMGSIATRGLTACSHQPQVPQP